MAEYLGQLLTSACPTRMDFKGQGLCPFTRESPSGRNDVSGGW